MRSIADLRDNVHVILDGEKRTLTSVDAYIQNMAWEKIAEPSTSTFLHSLATSMEGIESIWIADPDGYIKAASEPWTSPARVPEQEFFAAGHSDEAGIYISTVIEGTPQRIASIAIVRSRVALNGAFNGTIHAILNAAYFSNLFDIAAPTSDEVMLVRDDGEVLAKDSKNQNYYMGPGTLLMRQIAGQPAGKILADRGKLYSYAQVPGFPVYISLGVREAAILSRWHDDLLAYGVAAIAASLALLGVSWVAVRQAKSERVALTKLNTETERRLGAERRLHVAQRMEAVGELTAGIAHHFNNLLAVILGSLDLMPMAKDQERVRQLAKRARRAGERGAHLITSLLTFAGNKAYQIQTVNLNALLSEFAPFVKANIGKTVQVKLVLGLALQDCCVDVEQLEAALLSLAANANDAMPKGGTLTISTRNQVAEVDFQEHTDAADGPWVTIAVQDTGSGMSDRVKARMFEPFFTTKRVGEGSGLGLSQVLGFVRQMRGHITVDTKLAHGTAVTLYFPRASSSQLPPDLSAAERARSIKPERSLVPGR